MNSRLFCYVLLGVSLLLVRMLLSVISISLVSSSSMFYREMCLCCLRVKWLIVMLNSGVRVGWISVLCEVGVQFMFVISIRLNKGFDSRNSISLCFQLILQVCQSLCCQVKGRISRLLVRKCIKVVFRGVSFCCKLQCEIMGCRFQMSVIRMLERRGGGMVKLLDENCIVGQGWLIDFCIWVKNV